MTARGAPSPGPAMAMKFKFLACQPAGCAPPAAGLTAAAAAALRDPNHPILITQFMPVCVERKA